MQSEPTRLSIGQLPRMREKILAQQNNCCAVCGVEIDGATVQGCLDHDHKNGTVRGVLCRNCNSMEGKVLTCATRAKRGESQIRWLSKLLRYWQFWADNPSSIIHPTHKTDEDKRIMRNKKARDRNAARRRSTRATGPA